MSVLRLAHKIVSIPIFYNLSQKIAGGNITDEILTQELSTLPKEGSALDVGGGTGRMRNLLPIQWRYTCLDNDPQKLGGFHKRCPQDKAIQSSATTIPEPDGVYDLCVLSAVSHHLQNSELDGALAEISRVLRPTGQLLFLDALLNENNRIGKILWALDRGSFPRTSYALKDHIEKVFVIKHSRFWRAFHDCVLFFCEKKFQIKK
jgi:ubiquinone/menaquinone biosynthesis C-methylase UbiE